MLDAPSVRTTLDIDDDVVSAARSLAKVRSTTIGKVVSDLARSALRGQSQSPAGKRHGVPLFARTSGDVAITLKLVNELRDDVR